MALPEVQVGVDIGGTFTDFVLLDHRSGRSWAEKVLTTPDDPSRGVLDGLTRLLAASGVAAGDVRTVIHGTTLVANALIERKGVPTALVTTRGFRDVLEIGREWRYDIYDLFIEMVEPLVPRRRRFELTERMAADGSVIVPLDVAELEALTQQLAALPVEAVAVSFLHAFKNPAHERAARDVLRAALPGRTVCVSSDVMAEIGEYERTSTTVANAYVRPTFERYVTRLAEGLRALGIRHDLYLMQSDGGTVHQSTAATLPIRLVQSGPAGGVQATALVGGLAGARRVLCFDMGGTTAKSCLIEDGVPARTTDFEVARVYRFKKGSGIPLLVPAVDMIEIGAGGGSIARVNALGLIQVGPDSSGALPGPACYGQGGTEPTVTDADLVLGFLDAGSFLGGDMKLDPDAARRVIEVRIGDPLGLSLTEAAWGVCETVDENMSQATTIHALEKGLRAADFTLVAIGGAGPVHAAHVARKMGIGRVICPAGAGVASAFGFLAAPLSFESVQADVTPLAALDADAVRALVSGLEQRGRQLLAGSGVDERDFGVRVACAMRYIGQGHEVEVAVPPEVIDAADRDRLRGLFEQTYHALFGRIEATMPVEMVSWRVVVSGPRPDVKPSRAATADLAAALKGRRPVYDPESRQFLDTPVLDRYRLAPGFALTGPAIVEERESTAVVPARARAAVDDFGNLLIDLPA